MNEQNADNYIQFHGAPGRFLKRVHLAQTVVEKREPAEVD